MKKVELGSVVSGTLRKQDLIPEFVYTLLSMDENEFAKKLKEKTDNIDDDDEYWVSEESSWDIEQLVDEINAKIEMPYVFFGNTEGDGSDFGFWIDWWEVKNDFEDDPHNNIKVDDISDVPDDFTGLVLFVNDHGNVSLYRSENGNLEEIFSVV